MDVLSGMALGIAGGISWAVIGLIREKTKPESEPYDPKKTVKTVIIGAVTGGFIGYSGQTLSYDLVTATAETAGITAMVNKIVDAVWSLVKGGTSTAKKR